MKYPPSSPFLVAFLLGLLIMAVHIMDTGEKVIAALCIVAAWWVFNWGVRLWAAYKMRQIKEESERKKESRARKRRAEQAFRIMSRKL